MQSNLVNLTFEVNLAPGEKLSLPSTLVEIVSSRHGWPTSNRNFDVHFASPL
jgi:hypothetical protein